MGQRPRARPPNVTAVPQPCSQAENVFRVLRSALESKRALYGHTLDDSNTVFELADTDGALAPAGSTAARSCAVPPRL